MTTELFVEPFAVVDGGLSTALEALGHHPGGLLWTAQLLIDRADEVTRAHALYVEAGADVIISSSYQASAHGFVAAGLSAADARATLASTTEVARRSGAPLVASSIGPYGAIVGDGSEYHGRYAATWAEVRTFHRDRFAVLADTAPDLFAIETIPSRAEAEIIVEELVAASPLPAWVSFSCSDGERTCCGDSFADAVASIDHPQIIAVGVNCTKPQHVESLLAGAPQDRPFVVYPNHGGRWDAVAECWVGPGAGDHLHELAGDWYRAGARFIGGCCGIGPSGIGALVRFRDSLA